MQPEVLIMDMIILVQAIALLVAPGAARRGIFFGSTVDPAFSAGPAGRKIMTTYRLRILALTAISIVLANSGILKAPKALLLAAPPQLIGGLICLAAAARKTKETATVLPTETSRSAYLEVRHPALPGGWLLFLGPLMIPLMSGFVLWSRWHAIPEKYPIHWTLAGQPDRWMMKSFASVFGVLLAAVAMTALLLWMAYYISRRTRQVSTNPTAIETEQTRKRFAFLSLVALAYLMAFVNAWIILRPLWESPSGPPIFGIIVLPIAVTIVIVFYSLRVANSGSSISGDGTPDACWKWGLIYYNPDDPALIVEKRIGIGWTLNLGNRWSWFFSILILSIPLFLHLINRLVVGE